MRSGREERGEDKMIFCAVPSRRDRRRIITNTAMYKCLPMVVQQPQQKKTKNSLRFFEEVLIN
jgi:hypothetical protein